MSTYEELTRFLKQFPTGQNHCALSFDQIERIVKRKLPPSARKDRTFWANTYQRYYAKFWLQADWKVETIKNGQVMFVRQSEQQSEPDRKMTKEKRVVSFSAPSKRHRFFETPVPLNDQEFREIGRLKKTEDKALQIVKKYLRDNYGQNVEIKVSRSKGADLNVVFKDQGDREELIEVKGTLKPSVSWSLLKVSSQQSCDNLHKGIPLYRVISVNSRIPQILILKYGRDFVMEPEPRWAVKPARS